VKTRDRKRVGVFTQEKHFTSKFQMQVKQTTLSIIFLGLAVARSVVSIWLETGQAAV